MRICKPIVIALALSIGGCSPEAWDALDVLLEPTQQEKCDQASGKWTGGACWITKDQAACEGIFLEGECHVKADLD